MTGYGFLVTTNSAGPKQWFVYYNLGHNTFKTDPDIDEVKKKLTARASKVGLLGNATSTSDTVANVSNTTTIVNTYNSTHWNALLQVR